MFASNLLVVAGLAATGLATTLHIDIGCIWIGNNNYHCASDGPYHINGDTAQIWCKLDADPTSVTVAWPGYYQDIYWGADNCLYDDSGNVIANQCVP